MNPDDRTEILNSLEAIATLMSRWGVTSHEWCLLDGPAIKLHDNQFDATCWRDHLNIYVREEALPWRTQELELTVPPAGSEELCDLLKFAQVGIHVHLVPGSRYYLAGFERRPVSLPSGRQMEAATLRGCSQVWSYKSAEIVASRSAFEGDIERIAQERLARLPSAISSAKESDTRERLALLRSGYEALRGHREVEAKSAFLRAAGPAWDNKPRPNSGFLC
jgi:hypothetical protein